MALFKILKGQATNLPKQTTEGYAYFTTDEGNFYIDIKTGTYDSHSAAITAGARIQINANKAKTAEFADRATYLEGSSNLFDLDDILEAIGYRDSSAATAGEHLITNSAGKVGWSSFYVTGTQTAATNAWTGALPNGITSYYDGLTIDYLLPYAGTGSAATLKLGSLTAAPVRRRGNNNVTTHFPAGSVLRLTYTTSSLVNSGNGAWEVVGDNYDDGNVALRVYRQTSGYDSDYPLLVSRTAASSIGTSGTNSSSSSVYGVMWDDTSIVPTLNPSTGLMKIPGGISGTITNATSDVYGNQIDTTYFADWGTSSSGTAFTITPKNGQSTSLTAKALSLPIASASAAGLITTGAQTLTGDKTINSSGSLTIQKTGGFTYSGIQAGTNDIARCVWFADAGAVGRPVYDNDFKYNPSTNTLTVAQVTGNAASADQVNNSLTIGQKVFNGSSAVTVTAADLNLSSALRYIGQTSTTMSDGLTTAAVTINGSSVTPITGDVVIDSSGNGEYVWTGSWWELLGAESSYDTKGTAAGLINALDVSDSVSGYVSKVTQTDGKIAVSHGSFTTPSVTWTGGTTAGPTLKITTTGGTSSAVAVPSASASASGVVTTGAQTFAGAKSFAGNIAPSTTNTYSLGTSSYRWSKAYLGTADSYGSATKPVYWNNGVPAACTYSLSSTVNSASKVGALAYYSGTNEISPYTSFAGNGLNLWYLSSGVPTESTHTIGSETRPVYLQDGEFTSCDSYSSLFTTFFQTVASDEGPTIKLTIGGTTKTLTLYSASESYGGVVTASTQTFGGNKTFNGVTTFNSTTASSASVTTSGSGLVLIGDSSGYHVTIDSLGIMAKTNGTTSNKLYLNKDGNLVETGGNLQVGGGTIYLGTSTSKYINASNYTGNAATATKLKLYETRQTTSDLNKAAAYGGAGSLFHLLSTSSTTSNAAPSDSNVLQMNWDSTAGWDCQLAISTDSAQRIYFRNAQAGTWQDWKEVITTASPKTAVGSSSTPVYVNSNGEVTACSYSIGSTINSGTSGTLAYYSGTNAVSSYTSTKGSGTKLWYLNAGVPTESSSTIGSTTTPVYLKSGTITTCTGRTVPGIKSATSVSTLGWGTNNDYVPDISMMAYWNGAYSGTSSNLAYLGTIKGGTWNATTIGTAYGGTGLTSFTANRIYYPSSTSVLSASSHYISSTAVAINSTSAPSYTLYVNGTSYVNGAGTFAGNIVASATATYSLGTSSVRWSKLYVGTADTYGSATRPVYWNAGVPAACTYSLSATVNSTTTANALTYYSGTNAVSAYTSTKGGEETLWYLKAGVPTDSTATVGSESVPVYLNNGVLTPCTTTSSSTITALSWTAGTTAGPTLSATVGGTTKTAAIPSAAASASGVVTTGAQTLAGNKTFSGITTFSKTTDSSYSTYTSAAVVVKGGVSVANKVSAKSVKVDGGSTTAGCTLVFNTTDNCLEFQFA